MDENQNNKSGIGSIIATIIIIAMIVLGGLYFWGKRIEESKNLQSLTNEATTTEQMSAEDQVIANEATAIKSVNPSDDLDSISADLQNTKTTDLSGELNVQ